MTSLIKLLFGKPISSEQSQEQRLSKLKALPVFSSDALSSVAYATEEILRVLVLAGTAALSLSLPISIAICFLIAILAASYWQTIHAYPSGGGSFTVAQENLGVWPGLLAAAALLIDYVLTVAVSVSAGVRAITSAFPFLLHSTVLMCLLAVLFIALMNLRGVRESASVFAIPTYVFVVMILILVAMGIYQIATGKLTPETISLHEPVNLHATIQPLTILLILRAFSVGCTALTGVECVANGVPVFEPPESRNASQTLVILAVLLTVMFFGITYLADHLSLHPEVSQSLISEMAHYILGNGFLYYALQLSTMLILLLAANTSFAGFPRLASILSKHRFLPQQLSSLGDHLSFSNGIVVLAFLACLLLIIFRGDTHLLIPLYAVGVFAAFSLSQLGMVFHWLRLQEQGWYWKAFINGLGFLTTTTALAIIIESKFLEGAWIVVLCVPVILFMFYKIRQHYDLVERELTLTPVEAREYLHKLEGIEPKVILPVSRIHRGTLAALNFACSVSMDVTAVAVDLDHDQIVELQKGWNEIGISVPLIILPSPYRSAIQPLLNFIKKEDLREPERGLCMLVMPEAVPTKWWHHLLHNQRAMLLKTSLYYNRKHKGGTRIFVDVPYQLRR